MLKDIPNFYQANPEFKGKTGKDAKAISSMQEEAKIEKRNRKLQKEQQQIEEDEEALLAERAAELERDGGEINVLDAAQLTLSDPILGKFCAESFCKSE